MFGKNIWEKIIIEENNWDQIINADMVEGTCGENLSCMNYKCYSGHKKTTRPSEVNVEMVVWSSWKEGDEETLSKKSIGWKRYAK